MAKINHFPAPEPIFVRPDLLLHPNIPKPLHGVNPRSIKGDAWWDKTRKEVYKKNNNCCFACGVHRYDAKYHQWLEAHESYEINYETGEVKLIEIVALCHSCHNYIHDGRMKAQVAANGLIEIDKFNDIIEHGNRLVANIEPMPVFEGIIADWNEWHLVFEGKKYYSRFKSYSDWSAHYGR